MNDKKAILLALTAFLFSCGNPPENKIENVPPKDPHHEQENAAIETDNGRKWKVDENMMVYMRNMENEVLNFNGKEIGEFKTLSENLMENIDLLTSNCTMEGKAHDELHKWLVPYMELIDKFAGAQTEQEASEYFQQIKTSFGVFHQYFQ